MDKIASPSDFQAELRRILAYAELEKPSRSKLASDLRGLAERVAMTPESEARQVKRLSRELQSWGWTVTPFRGSGPYELTGVKGSVTVHVGHFDLEVRVSGRSKKRDNVALYTVEDLVERVIPNVASSLVRSADELGWSRRATGLRPGTPVEVLKIWAHGAAPAWRGGYTYVRSEGRGTSIVRQEGGTFAGTEVRFRDSDIRPARR